MKIGVLSDTHDQYENILKAVRIFNEEKVGLVIHCGDWISPFVLNFFKELKCPIKGVFGNNDGDRFMHLVRSRQSGLDVEYQERVLKLNIDNRSIYVCHGDYEDAVDAIVAGGKYDAVFHGHTHINVNKTVGKTLSLNPGTLMPITSDKLKGISFAIYNSITNTAELIKL